jgi:predicted cupin superfamily sugar epimerase
MTYMGKELQADDLIRHFRLQPLLVEGGYYVETYRAAGQIPPSALPPGYAGPRSFATAIYYLLTPDTFSGLHRLPSDEMFHFYLGDPVEMLQLRPDGSGEVVLIGSDWQANMHPQVLVPGGVWQGCRLAAGGRYTLMGVTVAPGFESADFESGAREALLAQYPAFADLIRALTR